jgi:Protein of unknown function (DUF3099)
MAAAKRIQSITTAPISLSSDQSKRARKYFISMMIRTVCFVLTVILPNPFRWITFIGALFLPYISVIVANAGRETISGNPNKLGNTKEIL